MPRRDPLAALARVRAVARDVARRDMAVAEARLAETQQAVRAVEHALTAEAVAAAADYAAWLPAAWRDRDRAGGAARRAEAGADAARKVLVRAGAEAEAVAVLLSSRRLARRRVRLAAEQAALDDLPR